MSAAAKEQHQLAPATETKKVADDTTLDPTPLSQPVDAQPQLPQAQFIKVFNSAYNEFYRNNALSDTTRKLIEEQDVDIELFDHLTEKKQNQRYISLLDGRIIFHELPNAPHGRVIDRIHDIIWRQIDHGTFEGCSYNDCPIGNSKKRPDASWRSQKSQIPNPGPSWIKLLPNNPYNLPFPSIVVEGAVNNESPAILQAFAQRYFAASTSVSTLCRRQNLVGREAFLGGMGRTETERHGMSSYKQHGLASECLVNRKPRQSCLSDPDGNCLWTRNSNPSKCTRDLGHKRGGNSTTDCWGYHVTGYVCRSMVACKLFVCGFVRIRFVRRFDRLVEYRKAVLLDA